MCSRHLPRSQPLTCLQAIQYVKPSRRFPKTALLIRPRSCLYLASFILRQPAACTLRRCRGVWGPPNFAAHAIPAGDVWHGCHGISLNYDTYHPRRGGSPSEDSGTLRFYDARLLGIDETRVLSNRNSGVTTPHPQGASCAIHA